MSTITRNAYAKINLSLDVLRRRDDGYHEVRMIMQTIGIHDVLNFSTEVDDPCKLISFSISDDSSKLSGNIIPDLGPVEKNLIYKSAKLLYDEFNIKKPVNSVLKKHIPVAAGMAGGSTDAAAVFHGLNDLFDLNMSLADMCKLGVQIGADVPYCIMGGTALSEGIGEILTPINRAPDACVLIAKPNINVSTKFVYENLHADRLRAHPDVDGMIEAIENNDILSVSALMGNVLETVTVNEYPVIEKIKQTMKDAGALNALMSGSGPTVFGLFLPECIEKAKAAESRIRDLGLAEEVFVTKFIN